MNKAKFIKAIALANLIMSSNAFAAALERGDDEARGDDRISGVGSEVDANPQHNGCCGGSTCNGKC